MFSAGWLNALLNAHLDSIDSNLAAYEDLSDDPMFLERAILKNVVVLLVRSFL